MAKYLCSYDLEETFAEDAFAAAHPVFLKQAVAHGWQAWMLGSNNLWYRLPYTTLQGTFADMATAELALEAPAPRPSATISKWIIVQYDSDRFSSDER
ncbi:hypothetical protein NLM33_14105 [Bradyrhizobium sp. CCGUVB1N3]|uniref:hypothetical protein n=1 Tax=Bradyrhizobium sp. CCGUVB1N3 TaxID=2949629 RepID=UPI0020B2D94F|nr:hypothetical protein [Bradyrhizobium sp. CCGUVB1N3]MCP3471464.1 hypothetical protein [Bradyrhizobium sp. CCGUVB1N3]